MWLKGLWIDVIFTLLLLKYRLFSSLLKKWDETSLEIREKVTRQELETVSHFKYRAFIIRKKGWRTELMYRARTTLTDSAWMPWWMDTVAASPSWTSVDLWVWGLHMDLLTTQVTAWWAPSEANPIPRLHLTFQRMLVQSPDALESRQHASNSFYLDRESLQRQSDHISRTFLRTFQWVSEVRRWILLNIWFMSKIRDLAKLCKRFKIKKFITFVQISNICKIFLFSN